MKLVLATPLFPPDSGGPATDSVLLYKELPTYGIEATVCSFGTVRHLPRGIRHLCYTYNLLISSFGANGIIAFDTFSVCLPAVFVSRLLFIPLIVRVPGDFAWEQASQRFGVTDSIEVFQKKRYSFKVEMMRSLQSFAARSSVLLVVPSDFLRGIVAQWGIAPKRLVRIYLGLDFNEETTAPSNVPEGKILFSLGRFVPWKGFSMLIALMPDLPKGWHLVLAGNGLLREQFEQEVCELGVADRVTFTGDIPRPEALGWYRRADAFALNTSFESFSFQILEAMTSGTPIITTAIGSIPELITNGVEGVLCTPNDSEAFKKAIVSVETEPEKWKTRTEAAKRKAQEFSTTASVSAFVSLVTKICA